MHGMTKNDNRASMHGYLSCIAIWCNKKYVLTLKGCFSFNNHENASINFKPRRNFDKCAFRKASRKAILVNTALLQR